MREHVGGGWGRAFGNLQGFSLLDKGNYWGQAGNEAEREGKGLLRAGSVWDLEVWGIYSGCEAEQVCVDAFCMHAGGPAELYS